MKQKHILLALALALAVVSSYIFTSKTSDKPMPAIHNFSKEISQHGGIHIVVFRGTVVNPLKDAIHDVNVTIRWSEYGNIRHVDYEFIGEVLGGSSIDFMISFECEYLLMVQSASSTLNYS